MATRRQVIGSVGTLLAGGAVVSASTETASAQADMNLTVPESQSFDSEKGYLRYLRVSPAFLIDYSDFSEPADKVRVRLFATVGGKTRKLSTKVIRDGVSGVDGEVSDEGEPITLPESDLVHVFGDDTFTTGITTVAFRIEARFNNGVQGETTEHVDIEVVTDEEEGEGNESANADIDVSLTFDGEGA